MMKTFAKAAALLAIAGSPVFAFATTEISSLEGLINKLSVLVAAVIPFIMALAVLVIIWGLFNYIAGAGDEEKRAQAKQYIIWGIIGLFVMVSIWGLVNVLKGSFDFKDNPPPAVQVPIGGGGCAVNETAIYNPASKTVTCVPAAI